MTARVLCMPGSPARVLGDLHALSAVPFGRVASLPASHCPVCRGACGGHTSATVPQLHDPSARPACLPTARSHLTALPLHVPNVCVKLATLRGSRLHAGLGSSARLLAWEVQGRRSWPGTASLPLETFDHWHRKPSVRRPHHVTAIVMPILPADHVPGPPWSLALPSPFQEAALSLGFPACALSMAEIISSLWLWLGRGGSDSREGGHAPPGQPLCPAPGTL